MIYETGFLSSVSLHPDGRITMIRADRRAGMFLHIELTEAEIKALGKVLAQRALDKSQTP